MREPLSRLDAFPVLKRERGCSASLTVGCACTGACHELIDVVPADAYWRAIGERDELRRILLATSQLADERKPLK